MINQLTNKQIEKMPYYVDKWLKIGLSIEPFNEKEIKKSVKKLYNLAGLKEPNFVIFVDCPYSIIIASIIIKNIFYQLKNKVGNQVWNQVRNQVWNQAWNQVRDQVGDQVGDQVRDQVADQVGNQVWNQVRNQVGDQVRDQVADQVGDQVGNQVGDQIWNQVWNQVRDQVRDQVGNQVEDQVGNQVEDQVGNQVWNQVADQIWNQVWNQVSNQLSFKIKEEYKSINFCFGQNDASWLSFYDFFSQECNLKKEIEKLNGLIKMCKTGWFITYENVCIISRKPKEIHMENKLLHNLNGPSILFNNGFSIYSFRGIKIPSDWIENPKSLTAEIALGWNNIEQRRAACEILGWDKILNKLNSNIIDNDNEEIGQLLLVNIPDSGEEKFLRVKCGTGRTFAIPVPPEMQTAKQANAWTYGLETNQLNVEVRT